MPVLVSIIVPCYNQAKYLDECLYSVYNQIYQHWECIIVNDGSPDNTEEIAKEWLKKDNRFKYFNKKNAGVASARNLGLSNAKGKYIQFLDGDDILEKNKLLSQVTMLEKQTNIDIVYTGSRYFYSENINDLYAIHPLGIVPTIELHFKDKNQLDVLLLKNICTVCAGLYRRTVFDDLQFENTVYEDYLLHVKLAANNFKFHFHREDNSLCLVRITSESQMLRHINTKNDHVFKNEIKKIKNNHYSKFIIDQSDLTLNINKKQSTLKNILMDFLPPILIRTLKKVYND